MSDSDGNFSNELADWRTAMERLPPGLPRPMSWHLLLLPVTLPRMTPGGIILTDSAVDANELLNFRALVVGMGPVAFRSRRLRLVDAEREVRWVDQPDNSGRQPGQFVRVEQIYGDTDAVPKVGDWIIYNRHNGLKIEYRGMRFIMCDDDAVLAKIDNPEGYKAYTA